MPQPHRQRTSVLRYGTGIILKNLVSQLIIVLTKIYRLVFSLGAVKNEKMGGFGLACFAKVGTDSRNKVVSLTLVES